MYVGFNCKKRKGGKKMSVNYVHKEGAGVRRVMEKKNILDFHFDYLIISLGRTRRDIAIALVGGRLSNQAMKER